ncbi:hypothetical protein ACQ5SK_26825 [Bradyrhizobium japonicum]
MAAGSVLACVVQQTVPDLLPARLLPVETGGIRFLDLNNALAPAAGNPQDMLRHLTEALAGARTSRNRGLVIGIIEEGMPVLVRHVVLGTERTLPRGFLSH